MKTFVHNSEDSFFCEYQGNCVSLSSIMWFNHGRQHISLACCWINIDQRPVTMSCRIVVHLFPQFKSHVLISCTLHLSLGKSSICIVTQLNEHRQRRLPYNTNTNWKLKMHATESIWNLVTIHSLSLFRCASSVSASLLHRTENADTVVMFVH